MVNNPNLIFFVIVLLSYFSTCTAEDFWVKTNYTDKAYEVFCPNINEVFIVSSDWDTYISQDMGNTWNKFLDYQTHYINDTSEKFYITYYEDSLFVVDRNTEEWEFVFKATGVGIDEIYETKSNYFIRGYSKLIKSDLNWSNIYPVLTVNGGEELTCFVVDSVGTYYVGSTDFFNLDQPGGVYKSFDKGETWTYPDLPNHFVRAMAVDSEGRIFVGTCGHYFDYTGQIYRSEDNGSSWQLVANGVYVLSMAINSEDEIFVGLDYDSGYPWILFSNDNGDSWSYLNEGLSTGSINNIAITPGGYVYLATGGGSIVSAGVYRSATSTTGIEESESELANNFELYQNYPNPFNNETVINFNLNKSCHVQLSIFNYKGELIKDIKNQKMRKGYHSVNLNACNLGTGVYYYSLKVDNKTVSTKKMLYIR